MTYKEYIKSEEWYNLKLDLLNIRGRRCEKCGKKKQAPSLHIHHLTYERLFNERAEDLQILCAICHMKTHNLIKGKVKKKNHKRRKIKAPKTYLQKLLKIEKRFKQGKYKNTNAYRRAKTKASF